MKILQYVLRGVHVSVGVCHGAGGEEEWGCLLRETLECTEEVSELCSSLAR